MNYKAKIIGAGSIGNHLAQAFRSQGWEVAVVDKDPEALRRMKDEIYPKRYGAWDESIKLYAPEDSPKGGFDVILVGTPPDTHLIVATQVLKEEAPKILQIEKPLCGPTFKGWPEFIKEVRAHPETRVVVGYNHLVAENTKKSEEIINSGALGKPQSLDCEFRSHWKNIFDAHHWLKGPEDSYLGFWKRGGGAGGEHSHGINLWQHLAHVLGQGRVAEVSAVIDYAEEEGALYDRSCFISMVTEKGLLGRLAQDVIRLPKEKFAHIQFDGGSLTWKNDVSKTIDQVIVNRRGQDPEINEITKTRTEEFAKEIGHIQELLEGKAEYSESPVRLERGYETMAVLAAAHQSAKEKKTVKMIYDIDNQGEVTF